MRREKKKKKPFQEKKIQSRSQSYCAFWTKGTMCLATESFCNGTEATSAVEKNPLIHLSFLVVGFFFHLYSPVGRNIRERKQTGSGRVCVSVRRDGLRPTERTNPTKRTGQFSSEDTQRWRQLKKKNHKV